MNILVTGAKGNLGQHIISNAGSHSIEKLCRSDWGELDNKLSKVDTIIHAAGDIRTSVNVSPVRNIESNLLSTMRLLESSLKHDIKHFYFVSSCAVYGDVNHTNENQLCHPISLNGDIKKINETIISSFCKENSIDFTFFRVFNTFGGDDNFSIVSKLLKEARTNGTFTLNNHGLSQRDFIHVDDIAKVILATLELDVKPDYLNVGTGTTYKIIDLYHVVKEKFPNLKINYTDFSEIEYSRADNSSLLSLMSCDFISVIDYLKNEIEK